MFFHGTASRGTHPLSLHDALPISAVTRLARIAVVPAKAGIHTPQPIERARSMGPCFRRDDGLQLGSAAAYGSDRKSTRLNSSHTVISYAVFCLKKKKNTTRE